MERKAVEGFERISERFSSLLFLSIDLSALTACLRAALVFLRCSLADSIDSGVGLEILVWLRSLFAFWTALSRVRISGLTEGLEVLEEDRSMNLLVDRAANDKEE